MNVLKKRNNQNTRQGFTIIEVVLVLAIAGLIFLMVFIALPALQSSQRDTARKNDVSAISSAITQYTGNNRGKFPNTEALTGESSGEADTNSGKFAGYAGAVSNNTTKITVVSARTPVAVAQGEMVVVQGSKCDSSGAANNGTASQSLAPGTTRQFAIVTFLEAGGGTSYCQDS